MARVKRERSGIINTVHLNSSAKINIHFFIEKIRDALYDVDIPARKKDSLFTKLNAFASEVDRAQTRTDALFSFVLDLSATVGEAAEKLKPLRDLIEPLLKRVGEAKEQTSLPTNKEKPMQIEPPRRQLPPPELNEDEDLPS